MAVKLKRRSFSTSPIFTWLFVCLVPFIHFLVADEEEKVGNGTPSPPAKRKRLVVCDPVLFLVSGWCSVSLLSPQPCPSELPVGTVMAGGGLHKEENEEEKAAAEEREKKKLAIMMMTKRRRDLYEKIMKGRRKKATKVSR